MSYELTTAPSGRVVSTSDLKSHLRELSTDRDSGIELAHDAAVERFESDLRRQFLTATWKLHLPKFPSYIEITRCPVQSVSSITYVDAAGATQTLASDQYQVNTTKEPAIIRPAYGVSWPTTRDVEQAVTVTFVCGYGTAADVPSGIVNAIELFVEGVYEGNESGVEVPIERLIARYQWRTVD